MTDLSNKIQEHGTIECDNCPRTRKVIDHEVEACECGRKSYPIKDLPEPVDWTPVKIEEER